MSGENVSNPLPKVILPEKEENVIHVGWEKAGGERVQTTIEHMYDAERKDFKLIVALADHLTKALETIDNRWVGIFLQGSQNYGLDTEESNVDTCLLVLPTLDQLLFRREPVNKVIDLPNGEKCVVKDIRLMFDVFRKQNINSLEILATRWRLMNPDFEHDLDPLFENVEHIARYDNYRMISALWGTMCERDKTLIRATPKTAEVIERYGYDGYSLCFMDRIYEFFTRFIINNEPFTQSLTVRNRDLMLAAKAQAYTLDCALTTARELRSELFKGFQEYQKSHPRVVDKRVDELLDKTLGDILLKSLRPYTQERIDEYESTCGL